MESHKTAAILAMLAIAEAARPGALDLRGLGRSKSHRLAHCGPVTKQQAGRNDPCPCGSGRKFKKCCLGKKE